VYVYRHGAESVTRAPQILMFTSDLRVHASWDEAKRIYGGFVYVYRHEHLTS